MPAKRVTRKIERTPEQLAELKATRERYQRDKPTVEQLMLESNCSEPIPLGEYLAVKELAHRLKAERLKQKLTLEQVSESSGIDQATLSKLENGRQPNPTLNTLARVAYALGKEVVYDLRNVEAKKHEA
jgi:DNA-binding Xre family transcriptional regulator